jgi:hypothetical protein
MQIVDIHDARRHQSWSIRLPKENAKAGKPLVKVAAIDAPTSTGVQRLGFMAGQITVPDDFDEMGHFEIKRVFEE